MPPWKGTVARCFSPSEFLAYVADLKFRAWRPDAVVVHNTQIPTLAQWQRTGGERAIAGLERYYRDSQHWSGGPHLFVEPAGIWVFTPLTVPGVHSPSWNATTWGLEIVGDYDREPLVDETKENVLNALCVLHRRMSWDEPRIRLHREDPKTTHTGCPGAAVRKDELEIKLGFMLITGTTII